ncbi:MAG TPA: pyridoxamine 5'-phosphate oxidase family protein, partial [Nitrososphaera sp.]
MNSSIKTAPVAKLFECKNFAYLATLMEDGSPQVTPVWIDIEGDHLLVNTAHGRLKQRNVSR